MTSATFPKSYLFLYFCLFLLTAIKNCHEYENKNDTSEERIFEAFDVFVSPRCSFEHL